MPDVTVRVNPGSRQEELKCLSDVELHVKIRAKPVDGEANQYLIRFLSEHLSIPKSKITLLRGNTSRIKKVRIEIEPEEWLRRCKEAK